MKKGVRALDRDVDIGMSTFLVIYLKFINIIKVKRG